MYSTIGEGKGDVPHACDYAPVRVTVHCLQKEMLTPRGARIHYGVYGLGRLRDPAMCTGWAWAVTFRNKPNMTMLLPHGHFGSRLLKT